MQTTKAIREGARAGLRWLAAASLAAAAYAVAGTVTMTATAREAGAQIVVGGDFDICDYCGTLRSNTAFISGRVGFGTDRGRFVLMNAQNESQDVDNDGYTPGVNFFNLAVTDTSDFTNIANPDIVISRENLVLAEFPNPLINGFSNGVEFYVNIPNGTPAGIYRGRFDVTDTVNIFASNPNGETIRADFVLVEIEVLPQSAIGLVRGDTAAELDSLVLRGRAGQTVSGVARVANLGNVDLNNVRIDVTDLIATSGTGLRIRRERISFTPEQLVTIARADTARITVTVRIPTGLLAGSYRGELIVQGDGVAPVTVPITVIVETPGDIVFETNPVVTRAGDRAVIIFNADAGTGWDLRIFDMMAMTTFAANGTVFEADQAVRFTWPLVNGRGENVAGGMYQVIINVTQNGERRQLRGKLMVIR